MLEARVLLVASSLVVLLCGVDLVSAQITVSISATASHPVPSTMFGQMFEDISSGDGGLYAELLQNRAFQKVTPGPVTVWTSLNGGNISVIEETVPVSSSLPNALQLSLTPGEANGVGFANPGYSGIHVAADTQYKTSFYYRFQHSSPFKGTLNVGLQDEGGTILATYTFGVTGSQTTWRQVQLTLDAKITPESTKNMFTISVDGNSEAGENIHFAMLSLFPPTFKNRENGMRVDIAQALSEMRPSFFRLPGGNNLEGEDFADRWQWNNTVGSLVDRPGRNGDWTYVNTDGLGLLEYLYFCEDLDMQPIMAVWAGYSLSGKSLPEDQLTLYIQQAIDQINFVVGDPAKSEAAALRASLGRPEPFTLNYVEVGNEDFFAANSYIYRWKSFVTALRAEFPDIYFIATSSPFTPILKNATHYDVHVYETPTWFAQNSFYYDGFERNGTKYFEGEYAAISTSDTDPFGSGRLLFPTMQSSAAEAAFITGLERNSDIVFAASYAPLLGHVTNHQWTPNLLAFDAGSVYRSTSYYVQKLFSLNRGDEYLPSTLPDKLGSVFWSVVRSMSTNEIIIKVANTNTTTTILTFVVPFENVDSHGSLQLLTGNASSSNTPANPALIVPVTRSINTGQVFNYNAPPFSVSVITFKAY